MNPDLKDLRVAVVPSETDNGIDQSSSYEEIVACEETTYFSVADYFKAQNDEILPTTHWSFLLDYNEKKDCTGMNTDGIDMFTRATQIHYIETILKRWGVTTASHLELDSSPCISSTGTNKNNVSTLVERFNVSGVEVITYHNETEIANDDMDYEDLDDEVFAEVLAVIEDYEAICEQDEKRMRD